MWPGTTTGVVALLGDPVAHSLSPDIHNAGFRALELDLVYLACRVAPARLADAIGGLHALGALGANVTVPHKVAAAALVDELTPEASAIGAVNTLVRNDVGWLGANTDVAGFLAALGPRRAGLRGEHVVILGAGGVARAASYALLTDVEPARLTIAARRVDQADAVAAAAHTWATGATIDTRDLASAASAVNGAALIVNATTIGMPPGVGETPLADPETLHPGQLVFDLVYAPAPTRLGREAMARGADTIDGSEMLVNQAAASFKLWTGRDLPLGVVRAVARPATEAA